jgi:hypothetical protein
MTLLPEKSTLLLPFRRAASDEGPLRVGVVLDRTSPWTEALLSLIKQLPGIDLVPFTVTGRSPAALKRPSWLLNRLYSASQAKFDPFGDITVDQTEPATIESLDGIRNADCGVLIWLAGRGPNIDLGGVAKHGVLTVRFGKRDRVIPFWDEVADNDVTSMVTVYWHESSFARGRAVRTAETSTVPGLYITLSAEEPLAAAIRTLASLCLEIREGNRQFEEKLRGFPEESLQAFSSVGYPGTLETGRFVLSKLARSGYLRWKARGKESKWFIATRPNSGHSITEPGRLDLSGFRDVPFSDGIEAADPFLWDTGGHHYLFFEEIIAGSRKGRLGCVELFDNGSCSEIKTVLEQPYHLSYPCVVPAGGELFLLPETSEAGRVELYRFSRFPWEVELVATLVEDLAVVDTTPLFWNGRWYFFTTTLQPFMETLLFWSERLDGGWNLHPSSPVSCSVRNSRSAGNLFCRNGRIYRPTQDCSVRYGYAIQVNEVIRLTPTEFEERRVNWIPPAWSRDLVGTHTWNESSGCQVIDGIRWQAAGMRKS